MSLTRLVVFTIAYISHSPVERVKVLAHIKNCTASLIFFNSLKDHYAISLHSSAVVSSPRSGRGHVQGFKDHVLRR
jgi:hypothetical protein